jgi:hypothetical protein
MKSARRNRRERKEGVAARSRAAVMEGGFEPKSGCRTGDDGARDERWEHAVAVSRQTVVDQRRPVAADMRQGENSGADLTG